MAHVPYIIAGDEPILFFSPVFLSGILLFEPVMFNILLKICLALTSCTYTNYTSTVFVTGFEITRLPRTIIDI